MGRWVFLQCFFRSRGQTLLAASLTVSRAPVQNDYEDYFNDDDDDDDSNDGDEEEQITFSAES